MEQKSFPERLAWLRQKHLKTTYESLAQQVYSSKGYIHSLEKGVKTNPSSGILRRLSDVAGVSLKWLAEGTGGPFDGIADDPGSASPADYAAENLAKLGKRVPDADDCREYFETFLKRAVGDDPTRLGWVWMELHEKFPVDKWRS